MSIKDTFIKLGGEFVTPYKEIQNKLLSIRAWVFDWDGVFNNGIKDEQTGSVFAEPDAAGSNYLRFGHWLSHEKQHPYAIVITGANNPASFRFAQREHFHAVYLKVLNKIEALEHLKKEFGIDPSEVAFVFDDVLDLGVATLVGLRFLVRRNSSPLFTKFVRDRNLCDYITAHSGGEQGVREVCELVLGMSGVFDTVLEERIAFSQTYKEFLNGRNAVHPIFYTSVGGNIEVLETQNK
ncbi:MAG: phosphatase [Thermoflexibacter sp.]|jgi:3-deoxy-D-manno-octulosonate 8-phosphate phosphatase (KDO 8-P phosphatase)|nr:phosphatase [Thermoflexibacter sp.]